MRLSFRQPLWVVIGLMQPILYLVLFGPLLQTVAKSSGFEGDAWQVFVPGLLVQLGIFGGLFVGFGIIAEWRSGVIDRQMVTPASRTAIIAGRTLRDVVVIVGQAAVLTICAFFFGLRVPVAALVIGLVLVALLGAAFSFISNAIGMATKSEDALAPMVNTLALPILLLSGILLPMSLAPQSSAPTRVATTGPVSAPAPPAPPANPMLMGVVEALFKFPPLFDAAAAKARK